jgi:hypothetical protein
MRVSQFFADYELMHANVPKIEDLSDQHSVVIHMEIANWMQQSYKDGQPEFVEGTLVLSGIEDFLSDPPLNTLVFGEDADGEVISYGYVPERDKAGLEAGEIVMNWFDYKMRINTIVIISFLAKDAEWIPRDNTSTSE